MQGSMMLPCNQSGWLVERSSGPRKFLDLVSTCSFPFRGLVHASLDFSLNLVLSEIWDTAEWISSSALNKPCFGASCILSQYGNLEIIVAQCDGTLAHFWLNGVHGWRGPVFLPGKAGGPPAFIQGRFGSGGNFEVIVPRPDGGLAHYWRNNDNSVAWYEAPPPTLRGKWSGLGLVHNRSGNLQLVGIREEVAGIKERELVVMWQNGIGGMWFESPVMEKGFTGRPAVIQDPADGSLEAIAAGINGGLHPFLWPGTDPYHWRRGRTFAKQMKFDDITMLQSGQQRLELLARRLNDGTPLSLIHYRKADGGAWEGPNELILGG